MSNMVERLARAICERAMAQTQMRLAEQGEVWKPDAEQWERMIDRHMNELGYGPEFWEQARAALAAMREPDEAMENAGLQQLPFGPSSPAYVRQCWKAMIDTALQDKETGGYSYD